MFSFIETRLFTRLLPDCLSDDEYARLQRKLMQDPEAGAVIRGSGGYESFAGRPRAAENAVATGSSTSCAVRKASSGC